MIKKKQVKTLYRGLGPEKKSPIANITRAWAYLGPRSKARSSIKGLGCNFNF